MIEAGGMAFAAVAPPAEGPPQPQSRTAQRGTEPFERAMARARQAEERGSPSRSVASEVAPEAEEPRTEKPRTEKTEATTRTEVAPEVAAIIEALIAPQQPQPDRIAEVGIQQEQSLVASVSGALASFEAPVPALAIGQVSVVAAKTAVDAASTAEPALETDGVVIDGLEAVEPELIDAPIADTPNAEAPVTVVAPAVADGSELAAPRGTDNAASEAVDIEPAAQPDGPVVSTDAANLDSEDGTSPDKETGAQIDVANDLAVPRGADAPAVSMTQPAEAVASTSVGRASETTATQPTVEVEAVARPVDTSNAPQLASRLADTVQSAVRTGDNSMRLVLNPPDLGQLDVRVVERPDGVTVTLAAESSDARDLLQQHLPALRAALEARDVRVDRLDVTEGSNAAGLGEANDQPRGRREQQGNERPDWSMAAALDGAAVGATAHRGQSAGTRLVDVRA